MTMPDRPQMTAAAVLCLVLVACGLSVSLALATRIDAATELADRRDVLARLEARARSGAASHGPSRPTTAPAEAFLDAATPGLAAAELQAYVARLADRHAVLVSFGTQAQAGEDAADSVRIEASLDVDLSALQVLLHQLETGTPYVFVESLTVRPLSPTATGGAVGASLRVTLGLRALWRRRAA